MKKTVLLSSVLMLVGHNVSAQEIVDQSSDDTKVQQAYNSLALRIKAKNPSLNEE